MIFEGISVCIVLWSCFSADLAHFQYQFTCKYFQCFCWTWRRWLHFCDHAVFTTKIAQTDGHIKIGLKFNIDFMGHLDFPSECCKHFNKINMPFISFGDGWLYVKCVRWCRYELNFKHFHLNIKLNIFKFYIN